MTIKEVSEKYNISKDTLRYYEKVGMIPSINRTKNGIRDYTESDGDWIEFVKCMRDSGLPIDVIVKYLELTNEGDTTFKERRDLLETQKNILTNQIDEINSMVNKLSYKIEIYDKAIETGILTWNDKC